jgi:hypothetical protein
MMVAPESRGWERYVWLGGALFTGLVGAKIAVAAYGASHDHSGPYSLYLLTFALDSVGDIFGSLFALATGLLLLRTHLLPRWLAWTAILAAPFLFTQAFGLGGVVGSFGLVLDLIGFLLLLIFVLVSSLTLFARLSPAVR